MKKILLSSVLCGFLITVSNADVRFGGHGGGSSSGSGSSSGYSSGSGGGSFDSDSGYGSHNGSSGGSANAGGESDQSSAHGGGSASGGSQSGSEGGKDKDEDHGGMFDEMPDTPIQKPDHGNGDKNGGKKDGEEGKHSDFGEHKPPTKPEFSHAKGNVSAVEIEWEDNTDNELGYKVFRNGELIKILPPNTTEFKDTDLKPGEKYVYEIRPFNEFGDGDPITAEVETKLEDVSHVRDHLSEHLQKMFGDKFDEDKLNGAMKKYQNGEYLTEVYKELLVKGGEFSDEEFVKNLYEVLLDKELTPQELEDLTDKLKNADMTREEMFYDVVSSPEFKEKMEKENIDNAFSGNEEKHKEHLEKVSEFVKRFYTKLLERDAEEGGYNYWAEKLADKDLSAKDIVKQFFNSEEFKAKNLSDEDFVKKAYEVIMGREADQSGVEFWTQKLQEGMSRDELIDNFLDANEFQELSQNYDIQVSDKVKDFVERFYTKALKRAGDPSGVEYWSKALKDSQKSAKEVAKEFFNSEEFKSRNLTDEEFIDVVYQTLMGRSADEAGKSYWLEQLQSGVSRDEMIDQFLKSQEFKKFALDAGVLIDNFQ